MSKNKTVAGTPQDPTIKFVEVELNGKAFKLCYDFNSIAIAESLTGTNLLAAITLTSITANQFRGLFYASLLKAQPKITLADIDGLLTLPNTGKIYDAISRTWEAAMPKPESDPNEQTEDGSDLPESN